MGAGAGLAETEHLFFYPEKDAQNIAVTQFVNADLGGTGLANTVKEVAAQSIKVLSAYLVLPLWFLLATGVCPRRIAYCVQLFPDSS